MKTLANRLFVFAAGVLVAGTMAYGQTEMKADIPFAFRTSNASLPAGTYTFYRMTTSGMTNTIRISGKTSNVLVVGPPLDAYRRVNGNPSIVFSCTSQDCSLREIRTADGSFMWFPKSHKGAGASESASLISIPLTTRNGD